MSVLGVLLDILIYLSAEAFPRKGASVNMVQLPSYVLFTRSSDFASESGPRRGGVTIV